MKATSIDSGSSPARESELPSRSKLDRLMLPIGLACIFLAYSGTLRYEFVYDDGEQIVNNRYLTSWSYLPRYFTEHLWSHHDYLRPGNYYRPLFLFWLRLTRIVAGVDATLWHLATLLIYLASVVAVYWMARRLLKDRIGALMAAIVFGLYPLHIEAAAWPSGVTEPLLALLFIPSFMYYMKSRELEREKPKERAARFKWIAASVAFYALAILVKETAIILPVVILAYELTYGREDPAGETTPSSSNAKGQSLLRNGRRALGRLVPFVIVSVIYIVIRAMVLGAIVLTPAKLPLSVKLLTAPSLLWGYLKLLVWPVGLSEFYDVPYVVRSGVSSFILPLAAVGLATASLWWIGRRIKDVRERRLMAFACAWIVIPLLPVLNVAVFREGDLMHDRYLFLPTVGLSILIAYGLRKIKAGKGQLAGLPSAQALAAMLVAGALGLATAYQHVHWANDIVLFNHSLSVAPQNVLAQNAFGSALSKRELYDEAITVLERLVESHPENPIAQYNLGYNYYEAGRYSEALPHLVKAVTIDPTDERQLLTLGVTLFYLDRYETAEQALREGIRLRADGLGLHYALGAVLKVSGRLDEALYEFKQELAYNPQYVSAYDQINEIEKHIQHGTAK